MATPMQQGVGFMILRQKFALSGFAFEFWNDSDGSMLGGFRYAWLAQAKNARLRFHSEEDAAKGDIQVHLNGEDWRVRHCYLTRSHPSDIRYTLEKNDGTVHAQLDVLAHTAQQRLPRVLMTKPCCAELGTSASWIKQYFPVTDSLTQQPIGCIREPSAIAIKRELRIELPGMEPAAAAFLGIVALIVRY